jgi:AraC-like DNA-binding protein
MRYTFSMYSSLDPSFAMHWHHACQLSETLRAVTVASARTGRLPDAEFHLVPTLVACLKGAVRVELPRGHVDLAVDEALLLPLGIKHRHAPLRAGSVAFGLGFMLDRADIGLHIGEDIWVATIPEQPARGHLEAACSADAAERLRLTCQALGQMQVDVIKPQAPMPEPTYRMWMYLRRERMSPISTRDVLRASGLGLTQAYTLFRAWFGTTPLHLLRQYRLDYARHLITQGQSVSAAAHASGFRSRRHLTAACQKVYGLPPTRLAGIRSPDGGGS